MSLINEALKRTRDSAYQPVHTPPPTAPGYQLQGGVQPARLRNALLVTGLVAVLAITGVVVLAPWVASRVQNVKAGFAPDTDSTIAETKGSAHATTQPAPMPEMPQMAEIASPPAPAPEPPAAPTTRPPSDPKASEDQLVAKVMERIKAAQPAAASPAASEPPKLVLQGITYARDGSEAMINGMTVHEGEDIEGARVVTIENRRVKLDLGGREIILRLP
jgi:cytoskeletal protein RodZ